VPIAVANYWKNLSASLRIRNYRLYFIGQAVSMCGTWMQIVALGWLVLELTGSGKELGLVLGLQFLPLLVCTPFAGVIADRFHKQKILQLTQSLLAFFALLLGILVLTGLIEMWMLYCLAFLWGLVNSFDNPARHTFVTEMVGSEHVKNAIALNSTVNNAARAIGPMIGGVLIATIGIAFCFIFNALSSVAIVATLFMMRERELHVAQAASKKPGQLLEGLRYVAATPMLLNILIMMAIIGTLSFEFQVSLPLLAQGAFQSDATEYAILWIAMGIGSALGGLFAAGRTTIAPHHFVGYAALFGMTLLVAAWMPTLQLAALVLGLVGFFSVNATALANTMLQLESDPHMRGRVMSLWTMAILGSTLIGGPIIGVVGEYVGARWGLAVGGIAAIVAAAYGTMTLLAKDVEKVVPEAVQIGVQEADLEEEELKYNG
jgi:MFS family permease